MFDVDPHSVMDHPCDRTNDAVSPAVPPEEPVRVAASTSVSQDIQEPSLPQDTPAFEGPSHSQHADNLPQLTEEQKEELMRIHTQLTSQENPAKEVTSFEFEEPRDQIDVFNAIFKEPHYKADDYNAILGEPQGEPDDSKTTSVEESDQEEWTPRGKSKRGRPIAKANVSSIELQGESADQEESTPRGKSKKLGSPIAKPDDNSTEPEDESDEEEWTPRGKSKQGRPKSKVKRKYTKRTRAKTQAGEGSGT